MPTINIRIEHSDGLTDHVDGLRSTEIYEFGKIDVCSMYALREELDGIALREGRDEIYLVEDGADTFGGVLRDTQRDGGEVELIVESFERLASDAAPTSGGENWDGVADSEIVQDALDMTPELSARTVETLVDAETFVFSHTSPSKKIRTVAEATGGEVMYYPDKTVEYADNLGEDKTGTTLSPANQNLSEEFNIKKRGGGEQVSHLRMLGAGEGDAQVQATVIPDDDRSPGGAPLVDADNLHFYDNPTFDRGDRRIWDTRINKDITDPGTLADQGQTLIAELNSAAFEVETYVEDETVNLGDWFHIEKPADDVDRDLRAVEVERSLDAKGVRYSVTFSNRWHTRKKDGEKVIEDTDKYNLAFEGSPVTINTGGGRQPVTSNDNYEFDVYYPAEVAYEHRVKLQVKGLPYRAYSSGAASAGGSHDHSFSIPNHQHDVDIPSHSHDVDVAVPNHVHPQNTDLDESYAAFVGSGGHRHDYENAQGLTTGTPTQSSATSTSTESDGGTFTSTENGGGTSTTTNDAGGTHTHDPEPGLTEFGTLYPGNCDVLINGQAAGVSLGDGDTGFEETVDVAGMLTSGSWNTIEITSNATGHLMAHLDVDVYRQINGNG